MKMAHAELLDTEGLLLFFFTILLQHSPAAMEAVS